MPFEKHFLDSSGGLLPALVPPCEVAIQVCAVLLIRL